MLKPDVETGVPVVQALAVADGASVGSGTARAWLAVVEKAAVIRARDSRLEENFIFAC